MCVERQLEQQTLLYGGCFGAIYICVCMVFSPLKVTTLKVFSEIIISQTNLNYNSY